MHSFQQDQAAGLRQMMAGHQPKIISLLSAISEQQELSFISNLAATISKQNSDVLVVQAARVDLSHYGIKTLPALSEVVHHQRKIEQAIKSSKFGFLTAKLHAKQATKNKPHDVSDPELVKTFESLSNLFEVVLVDAGLDNLHQLPLEVLNQHQILIQLNCDAESIKQAYSLIKRVYSQMGRRSFGIVVSNATGEQAATTFRNIAQVARHYMQVELEFLGAIPTDSQLSRATSLGRAVIDAFPLSKSAYAFKALAQRLNYKQPQTIEADIASFV